MSKTKKFFCILFCALLLIETCALVCLLIFRLERRPLTGRLPDIERITFSIGTKEEVEITEQDAVKLRSPLDKFCFFGATPGRQKDNTREETLHLYMKDGEKHTIVFEGYGRFLWYTVGLVNYDGREYYCDQWMAEHFKSMLQDYRRK